MIFSDTNQMEYNLKYIYFLELFFCFWLWDSHIELHLCKVSNIKSSLILLRFVLSFNGIFEEYVELLLFQFEFELFTFIWFECVFLCGEEFGDKKCEQSDGSLLGWSFSLISFDKMNPDVFGLNDLNGLVFVFVVFVH